jgi:hypothetical protein
LNLRMPESKSGALPLGDIPISALDSDTRGIIAWLLGKCKRKISVLVGFYGGKRGRGIRDYHRTSNHAVGAIQVSRET